MLTKLNCALRRHRRMNSKLARFVTCSHHYTSAFRRTTNTYGLSAILRMVSLLDGSIECIHIHMNDFADGHGLQFPYLWVVKKTRLFTAAWIVLTSALLFNQVGLHFFHDKHDAHEFFEATQQNKTLLLNHGEHCQACSLEVLFNVVLPVSTELPQQFFVSEFFEQGYTQPVFDFLEVLPGRGPPAKAL
jgi:hypothetical protein